MQLYAAAASLVHTTLGPGLVLIARTTQVSVRHSTRHVTRVARSGHWAVGRHAAHLCAARRMGPARPPSEL